MARLSPNFSVRSCCSKLDLQAIVYGEPEHCADFLLAFARAGVSHFVVRVAASDQETQMDRLAGEVLPLLGGVAR